MTWLVLQHVDFTKRDLIMFTFFYDDDDDHVNAGIKNETKVNLLLSKNKKLALLAVGTIVVVSQVWGKFSYRIYYPTTSERGKGDSVFWCPWKHFCWY